MEQNKLIPGNELLCFERDILAFSDLLERGPQLFLLCDENTEKFCLPHAKKIFPMLQKSTLITAPAGESCKTPDAFLSTLNRLILSGAGSNDLLLVLGGGALSDLGGFCAHVFKRGMKYCIMPTTLLAMVDAAIGGKNGINASFVKNIIGSFHAPEAVFISSVWLKTLPQEEINSGMGEVIKYALLDGKNIFTTFLSGKLNEQLRDDAILSTCAHLKQHIVQEDPFDTGRRKILNLGHTAGHALESCSHALGNPIPHGVAVAAGLLVMLELSVLYSGFDPALAMVIQDRIRRQFCLDIPAMFIQKSLGYLIHDKKRTGNALTWVLLEEPGKPVLTDHIPADCLPDVFASAWG